MTDTKIKIVLTGGGTAGHVLPGLSLVDELASRGIPHDAIHWFGTTQGVGADLVTGAKVSFTALPSQGFQRKIALSSVKAFGCLLYSVFLSWMFLRRHTPAVVVGLGGYASVPCGLAAALRRIPLIIMEQNAVAGEANRLLSRFAVCSAVAFDGTDLRNAYWTGNPVSSAILKVDRAKHQVRAKESLGVDKHRKLVVVFGGSLGARTINHAVVEAVSSDAVWGWRNRCDLHIRHITGLRDYASVQAQTCQTGQTGAEPNIESLAESHQTGVKSHVKSRVVYDKIAYEGDMASVYAAADIVVCRAGATTVAELATVGVPAILVPLPDAPRDHQNVNATVMSSLDAALTIDDSGLNGRCLALTVDGILGDSERLEHMAHAGRTISKPNASQTVVDLLESFM